jgi:protein-S-isoprenylcysteine O-methyltransferase Ste14
MSRSKLVSGIVLNAAIFATLLFIPAGTVRWWRAWVLLAVVVVGATASTVSLARIDQGLLEERFKPPVQKGQPLADKLVVVPLLTAFVASIAFVPLDVFRFRLLPRPGALVSTLGLLLFVAGWWIMTLALRENAFAAPVVKHQEERHQTVIDSGPYRIVRHPMYAGAIPFFIGLPLWLESYAAVLVACIPIALLTLRIVIEEKFLRRELAGYETYTQRVRYRLIPFVW